MAKVAIITRTKDRNLLLERAMKSVLGQTFKDWEMVIVNDGGVRAELDSLAEKYSDKFKGRLTVKHIESSGGKMEKVSNIGIKSSDSKYVIIHDDDDSWQPDFLKETVSFLDRDEFLNTKGVVTRSMNVYEKIEDNSVIITDKKPHNPHLITVDLAKIWSQSFYPPISFLYKRDVFDEIGYYDESLPIFGDFDFNLRFLMKYDIFVIKKYLANYHYRVGQLNEAFENSLFTEDPEHSKVARMEYYNSYLRNKYLREDLNSGKYGIGSIINFSEIPHIRNEVHEIYDAYQRFRNNKLLRVFYSLIRPGKDISE